MRRSLKRPGLIEAMQRMKKSRRAAKGGGPQGPSSDFASRRPGGRHQGPPAKGLQHPRGKGPARGAAGGKLDPQHDLLGEPKR